MIAIDETRWRAVEYPLWAAEPVDGVVQAIDYDVDSSL